MKELFLHAWSDSQSVVSELEARISPESPIAVHDVLGAWRSAQPKAQRIAKMEIGLPDTVCTRKPDDDWLERYLPDRGPWSAAGGTVAIVGLLEIVAPQRFVSLDYVDALMKSLAPSPTDADLVRLCITGATDAVIDIRALSPNQYIFSSPRPGLRLLGVQARRRDGSRDVTRDVDWTIGVGFGFPWVTLFSFQKRLILINGLHRLFALLKLGISEVPVIVHEIDGVAGLPSSIGGSRADDLLSAPRPPILKDFLDRDLAIALDARDKANALVISFTAESVYVPMKLSDPGNTAE